MDAIASSQQHAILGLPQIGDAYHQPNPDRGQGDNEGKAGNVCQDALPKIIRLLARSFVTGKIVRLRSFPLI